MWMCVMLSSCVCYWLRTNDSVSVEEFYTAGTGLYYWLNNFDNIFRSFGEEQCCDISTLTSPQIHTHVHTLTHTHTHTIKCSPCKFVCLLCCSDLVWALVGQQLARSDGWVQGCHRELCSSSVLHRVHTFFRGMWLQVHSLGMGRQERVEVKVCGLMEGEGNRVLGWGVCVGRWVGWGEQKGCCWRGEKCISHGTKVCCLVQ